MKTELTMARLLRVNDRLICIKREFDNKEREFAQKQVFLQSWLGFYIC